MQEPNVYLTPFVVQADDKEYPLTSIREVRRLVEAISGVVENLLVFEWDNKSNKYIISQENNRRKASINIRAIIALTHLEAETKRAISALKHKETAQTDNLLSAALDVFEVLGVEIHPTTLQELVEVEAIED